MNEQAPPVPVHIRSTDVKPCGTAARRMPVRYRTITLSSAQPVAVVAGTEPYRHQVIVRATGNDVYLTDTEASALAVANAGTGGGLDSAYLLPKADTAPTPYECTEDIWCAAIAYPATLSVMIISRNP